MTDERVKVGDRVFVVGLSGRKVRSGVLLGIGEGWAVVERGGMPVFFPIREWAAVVLAPEEGLRRYVPALGVTLEFDGLHWRRAHE